MRYFFGFILLLALLLSASQVSAQGHLSGNLQLNANFYDKDPNIGTNTTHYREELSSTSGWFYLNYRIKGFNVIARFDGFHNSPVFDPQEAYSEQGLGFYQISKDIDDLSVTGGYFYEQFGSGLVFRAYEDRLLGIDNAVQGFRLNYDITDKLRVTAFTGKQKQRFSTFDAIVKGANLKKDLYLSDNIQLFPGIAFVNRTHGDQTIGNIADEIRTYNDFSKRFIPKYNVYAYSIYNQLNFNNFTWYMEYANKSREAIRNKAGDQFINRDGYALYHTLDYSRSGLGINLQYRKNRTYILKTTPYADQFRGRINFMPPIAKQHTMRLTGRYAPQTLPFGEEAYQADIKYSLDLYNTFNLNLSYIKDGQDERLFSAPAVGFETITGNDNIHNPGQKLYQEINFNYYRRWSNTFKTKVGIQSVNYDRAVYQGKPSANMVKTITPFTEITYKFTRRKALRTELQYLSTEQDKGDFVFGLLEYTFSPHYSIAVSDMINTEPRRNGNLLADQSWVHYYSVLGTYTKDQTRFSLGYVKRVQGIVCTGGVCRVEPAFSGVQLGVTTNF